MNTLELHAQINGYIVSIGTALQILENSFKNIAPKTALDDACIDTLMLQAQVLLAKADQLKTVQYAPET